MPVLLSMVSEGEAEVKGVADAFGVPVGVRLTEGVGLVVAFLEAVGEEPTVGDLVGVRVGG